MHAEKIAYVLDFDGTVTVTDITTDLARRFGGEEYERVESAYRRGRYGMKKWLEKAVTFLPADLELMLSLALEQVVIRPGLKDFLHFARTRGNPVFIASDGFGFYIEPVLQAHGCLEYIERIYKNETIIGERGRVEIDTVHAHRQCGVCGNCKAAHVAGLKKDGYRVIYAGDGSNDRFGASQADLVFARDRLAAVCGEKGIPFTMWWDFHDLVQTDLPRADPPAPLCDPAGAGVLPPP